MPLLYADIIHSIMTFLHFEDLPAAIQLDHQWNNSIRTLKLSSSASADYVLTEAKWKVNQMHPTSPLLRHVTSIHMQFCPDSPRVLPEYFPSLRSIVLTDVDVAGISLPRDENSYQLRTDTIVDAIKMNENLTSVTIGGYTVDDAGAARIADAIKHRNQLQILDLSGNQFGDAGYCSIADIIRTSTDITSVNLAFNRQIRVHGATAPAEAIKMNETLTSFDISANEYEILPQCLSILAGGFKHSKSLKSLCLSWNSIDAAGVLSIADAVSHSTSLTNVDISDNQIRDLGLSHIAAAIKRNRSLTHIDLSTNKIGNEHASDIADAIRMNKSLVSLNLFNNEIEDSGAVAIAEAVKVNSSLKSLELGTNFFTDVGVLAFAEALTHNTTVTSIDLRECRVCDRCARRIGEALKDRNELKFQISAGGQSCEAI